MNVDYYIRNYDTTRQTTGAKREESRFSLYIKQKEESISLSPIEGFYRILFLLDGVCEIKEGIGQDVTLSSGEFLLLLSENGTQVRFKTNSSLLVLQSCNLLLSIERAVQENHTKQPLHVFNLSSTLKIYCQFIFSICRERSTPKEWDEIKERELFLLLAHDYSPEQLKILFNPVAWDKSGFRQKVKHYILQTSSITELRTLSGMKRTTFEKRFRKEFGNSPYKWILQKKTIGIKQSLLDPTLSLEEIRRKHGFNSASHFSRFCRKQFSLPPSALRKKRDRGMSSTNEIY